MRNILLLSLLSLLACSVGEEDPEESENTVIVGPTDTGNTATDTGTAGTTDTGDTETGDTGDTGTPDTGVVDTGDDGPQLGVILADDCGFTVGDKACNLRLLDQHGNVFDLHEKAGKVVILDISAIWCYWCKVAAQDVQDTVDTNGQENLVYATILVEDLTGDTVEQSEVLEWATAFHILTEPVLIGDRSLLDSQAQVGWKITGFPNFYFIGRDGIIYEYIPGWSVSWMEEAIAEGLNP